MHDRLKRDAFLALGSAALLARPLPAGAQTLRKLTVASAQDSDAAACLYAQEAGLFRKVGLDVTLIPNASGSAIASAVVGGAVDIGKSSLTALITAVSKGIPIVLVAPSALYNPDSPVTGTIVRADSPIKTARDLNGKTVSVQSVRGSLQLATMVWADVNGGDSSTIKFLELPPQAGLIALDSGRVDAVTLANPYMTQAISEKKARVLGWSSEAIAKALSPHRLFRNEGLRGEKPRRGERLRAGDGRFRNLPEHASRGERQLRRALHRCVCRKSSRRFQARRSRRRSTRATFNPT